MYSNTSLTCALAFNIMYSRILAQSQQGVYRYHREQYDK